MQLARAVPATKGVPSERRNAQENRWRRVRLLPLRTSRRACRVPRQLEYAVAADSANPWGSRCTSFPLFAHQPMRPLNFNVPGVVDWQARYR